MVLDCRISINGSVIFGEIMMRWFLEEVIFPIPTWCVLGVIWLLEILHIIEKVRENPQVEKEMGKNTWHTGCRN